MSEKELNNTILSREGYVMTIQDLKNLSKEVLTPNEVAPVLGCDPNVIRFQAKKDIRQLGFPAAKIGTRIKIPRQAFIDWFEGRTELRITRISEERTWASRDTEETDKELPSDGAPDGRPGLSLAGN